VSGPWIHRSAVEAPFAARSGIDQVGRAVWLYLHLIRVANHNGIVMRTAERLSEELMVSKQTTDRWLIRLSSAKLIRLEAPPPFLVIKLPIWPGEDDASDANSGLPSGSSGHSHNEVPVSSSKQQAAAASNQAGEGGAGEGEALISEVTQALDGAGIEEVRSLVAEFPKPVILKALIRVKTTPSSQIRKSKLALFRYLLTKFTANPHAH
jgi:hypothetical protein